MTTVQQICSHLETFAPVALAEDWDNVGLLVGRSENSAERIMTCLTVTPESVSEAIAESADLIVSHHPMMFRPIQQLTNATIEGQMLLDLIASSIAVYSPHTAFDSVSGGINQQWADRLQLQDVRPLQPLIECPEKGAGRYGRLPKPTTLEDLAVHVKSLLRLPGAHQVGDGKRQVQLVGVACGAAGSFLQPALAAGCQVLITGETSFHTCLEAKACGAGLILTGHYASERFAVERLADELAAAFPTCQVWPSLQEADPVLWI